MDRTYDGTKTDRRCAAEKKVSVDEFRELYYKRGYSIQKMADVLSTSESSIERYMKRHNLGRRLTRYNLSFNGMPELALAYFAGLFDGEGSITSTVDVDEVIRVEVSLVNTDARVLEYRGFFTHHRIRHNTGYNHNTRTHVLYSHNFKDIHSLLTAIFLYLKLKKTRARLMVKLCRSRMEHLRQPPSVRERRWVAQIRELNSRKGKRK